jgi:hypothetical protein
MAAIVLGSSPLFVIKYVLKYYGIDLTIARREPESYSNRGVFIVVKYPTAAPPKVSNLAQNN